MFLSSHLHQLFKLNHDPAKRPRARGRRITFLRDPKGETSLGLGGGHVFLRDPKGGGGGKKIL